MKSVTILAAILATSALCAQERPDDLNARLILFGEVTQTSGVQLAAGVKDRANYQVGPGVRFLGQFSSESHWCWEVAARLQSSANMVTNRDIAGDGSNVLNLTKVKVYYSYWGVGAGYLIPLGSMADFGVHLEGRGETINPKGQYEQTKAGVGQIDTTTVYTRPWVRFSLDLKIRMGSVRTILGGDASLAVLKTKQNMNPAISDIDNQTLRAMAPTWSGSLYAGFQF